MLSDVVADQVVQLRKRAGLRRDELADRCKELGADDLTVATLANIETGRKDKASGKRRRRVTVEELLALAMALRVSPVLLLADPRHDSPIPLTEGVELDAWEALMWLIGSGTIGRGIGSDPRSSDATSLIWCGRVVAEAAGAIGSTPLDAYRPGTQVRGDALSRDGRRLGTLDNLHRRHLETIAAALERIDELGAPAPQLPPHVLKRAAELHVELGGPVVEARS